MIIGKIDVDLEIIKAMGRLHANINGFLIIETHFMGREVHCLVYSNESMLSLKAVGAKIMFIDRNGDSLNHG